MLPGLDRDHARQRRSSTGAAGDASTSRPRLLGRVDAVEDAAASPTSATCWIANRAPVTTIADADGHEQLDQGEAASLAECDATVSAGSHQHVPWFALMPGDREQHRCCRLTRSSCWRPRSRWRGRSSRRAGRRRRPCSWARRAGQGSAASRVLGRRARVAVLIAGCHDCPQLVPESLGKSSLMSLGFTFENALVAEVRKRTVDDQRGSPTVTEFEPALAPGATVAMPRCARLGARRGWATAGGVARCSGPAQTARSCRCSCPGRR